MARYAQSFDTLLTSQQAGGVTLASGKAYFYVPGTETLKAIYTDRNKTEPADNPYTLSADGTAQIFGDGLYDIKITNSAGVQKFFWEDVAIRGESSSFYTTLEDYGGAGDDSTSNNAALAALVAAIPAGGAVEIALQPAGVYRFTATKGQALVSLSGLTGFKLTGTGAVLKDMQTYATTEEAKFIQFTDCDNIYIDPQIKLVSQEFNTAISDQTGLSWFKFLQGCTNIRGGARFYGGFHGFWFDRTTGNPASYISRDIDLDVYAYKLTYPTLQTRSGYNTRIKTYAEGCQRSYFAFGGGHHTRADITVKNQNAAVLLSTDGGGNGIYDIQISVHDRESDTNNASAGRIGLQFFGPTAATIKDVKIHMDLLNNASSPFRESLFINKATSTSDGTSVTAGVGHVLDNVTISGISEQVNNREHVFMYGAFASPDIVRNITIENFTGLSVGEAFSESNIELPLGDALEGTVNLRGVELSTGQAMGITHSTGRTVMTGCKMYDGTLSTDDTTTIDYFGCTIVNGGLQSLTNKLFYATTIAGQPAANPPYLEAGAAPASPQAAGTLVTVSAHYGTLPIYDFEFWVKAPGDSYVLAQAANTTETFAWDTTGLAAGVYRIAVQVQLIGDTTTLAEKILNFTITAP